MTHHKVCWRCGVDATHSGQEPPSETLLWRIWYSCEGHIQVNWLHIDRIDESQTSYTYTTSVE